MPSGPIFVQICAGGPRFGTIWAFSVHFRAIFSNGPCSEISDWNAPCHMKRTDHMDMFLFTFLRKSTVSGFLVCVDLMG